MTRRSVTGVIPVGDPLPVVLELMRAVAISVLHEHGNEAGQCMVCGSAWPCERVVLAAHNVAMV